MMISRVFGPITVAVVVTVPAMFFASTSAAFVAQEPGEDSEKEEACGKKDENNHGGLEPNHMPH